VRFKMVGTPARDRQRVCGQIGGHKPRVLSGAHADWLRARVSSASFTLRGLAAELAERGVKVDYRSVWEFAHREGLSFKKNRRGGGADQA